MHLRSRWERNDLGPASVAARSANSYPDWRAVAGAPAPPQAGVPHETYGLLDSKLMSTEGKN